MLCKVLAFGQVAPPGSSACKSSISLCSTEICFLAYRISVVKWTPPVYRTPFARGGSMYPLEVYPPLGGLVVPLA